jgi:hypothetical protein
MQDRDGARRSIGTRRFFPFIKFIFADAGTGAEDRVAIAKTGTWKLTIVQRNELHRSPCFPNAGSSSERSPGSATVGASPATSSATRSGRVYPSRNDPHHARRLTNPTLCSWINFLDRL